jgi:hypothetical protein
MKGKESLLRLPDLSSPLPLPLSYHARPAADPQDCG